MIKVRTILIFFSILLLFTTACNKKSADEMTNDLLQGKWTVQSWTLSNEEQMQTQIAAFSMEYEQQLEAHKGVVIWAIDSIVGQDPGFTGIYDIQNEGKEIIIEGDYFELEVTETELHLARFFDGVRWDIIAKREE